MKINSILFDDDELPEQVTVTMSIDEALYIGTIVGKQTPVSAQEFLPGGAEHNDSVYECLVGEVFNRYWDNGISDART